MTREPANPRRRASDEPGRVFFVLRFLIIPLLTESRSRLIRAADGEALKADVLL